MTSLYQWGWETDRNFDIEHHVRRSALPQPGRILELLALCSRLHSTLLDRHRPLWELHLIEGLEDGRFATYFKFHHALVDGVSATRLLTRDAERGSGRPRRARVLGAARRGAPRARAAASTTRPTRFATCCPTPATPPACCRRSRRRVQRALNEQGGALSLSAPRTMLNVPITGSRRFAAQSWPISRIRQVGKAADATVNDVVLAHVLRRAARLPVDLDALPDAPLIAMVPVSLHGDVASPRTAAATRSAW